MNIDLLKYLDKSDCLINNVFGKDYKVNTDFRNVIEFKKKLTVNGDMSDNGKCETLLGMALGKEPAKEIMVHADEMNFNFRNTLLLSVLSVMTDTPMELLRSELGKQFRKQDSGKENS